MLCVTYISFDEFGSGICESDEAFEGHLESHPFYHYLVRHWGDHVRAAKSLHPHVVSFKYMLY